MGFRGLFLLFIISFLCLAPAYAGTCFSESDCPKCTIDGMKLVSSKVTSSSLIGEKFPTENLACIYESEKVKTENPHMPDLYDSMEVHVSCYRDAATASQWYNWEMGTGEKPVPVDPAQEHRSSAYVGKIRCIAGLGPYKKTGTSTYYASIGCTYNYTVKGQYLMTFSPHTYYTYQEGNEPKDLRYKLLAWDQKYMDCFAGFSPKPAPASGEKTLHGTIIATKIPYGIEYPLSHAKLDLYDISDSNNRRLIAETISDDEGKYEFRGGLEKGKRYEIDIRLTYYDKKEYFTLYIGTGESESNKIILPDEISYLTENDLEHDIDLDTLWSHTGNGGDNPFGILYVHTAEALEFYKDQLHEDIHLNLPLKIIAFAPDKHFGKDSKASYYFNPDTGYSAIFIGSEESGPLSEYRPMNREYHEFSHYMMTNTYGRFLESRVKSDIPVINHDGYVNPTTSDSWEEGFAEFMAVVIGENYGYSCNGQDSFISLDTTYNAWDYQGKAEEYAVAGVLYDLYDGKTQNDACSGTMAYLIGRIAHSPHLTPEKQELAMATFAMMTGPRPSWEGEYQDDDGISLSLQEIWSVLKEKHPDFTSVYQEFVKRYPGRKTEIDSVFRDHGFFSDTSPGNATYDSGEPFRDANGNSIHESGEYFIDFGQYYLDPSFPESLVDKPHYDKETDTIGSATNYQRPWRLTTQKLPGHFVKVNNDVPFYTFTVEYPDASRRGYSALVRNNNRLIYVPVPPGSGAKITVTALGVTTGNPLVFTSDQFHENYMTAVKQGYYVSHDFQVSGPIPKPPVVPDFSQGTLVGKQSTGLFSIKGPLYDLVFGHAESRVPLIVSVPIIFGALLILAYVLKKEL